MATEFTEEKQAEIAKLAPKLHYLIVDGDGESVIEAETEEFAKELCGEGEVPVKYVREDLVRDFIKMHLYKFPVPVEEHDAVLAKLEFMLMEEPKEEAARDGEVPVPDAPTVL